MRLIATWNDPARKSNRIDAISVSHQFSIVQKLDFRLESNGVQSVIVNITIPYNLQYILSSSQARGEYLFR